MLELSWAFLKRKTELTVLDFVTQANRKYDFASRLRALTLNPEKNIKRQIEEGFTFLPHGCSIVMEKKASIRSFI